MNRKTGLAVRWAATVATAVATAVVSVVGAACAGPECEHLTDCPGALVCSADGACVDSENPAARSGGWRAGAGVLGGLALAGPSSIRGTLGPLIVDEEASVTIDASTLTVTSPSGALVFATGQSWGALRDGLTIPGARSFAGDEEDGITGMTCAPDYDEPALAVVIVVSEPDDGGGITVDITERNSNSDVTVTTGFQPL